MLNVWKMTISIGVPKYKENRKSYRHKACTKQTLQCVNVEFPFALMRRERIKKVVLHSCTRQISFRSDKLLTPIMSKKKSSGFHFPKKQKTKQVIWKKSLFTKRYRKYLNGKFWWQKNKRNVAKTIPYIFLDITTQTFLDDFVSLYLLVDL